MRKLNNKNEKEDISMSLIELLNQKDTKGLFVSDDYYSNYLTGILPLDYANGFYQDVRKPDGSYEQVPVLGVIGGTLIVVIGETQSGKTTFAEQLGYNIIRPFQNGLLNHIDAEKTALKQRIVELAQADPSDKRIVLTKRHTSIEDTLEKFNMICELKEANKKLMTYEIKNRSLTGETFRVYEPTVLIIDSLPSFVSKDQSINDLGTNTDGAREAKDLKRFISNILDRMWEYNITVICTNHIMPKTDMSGGFSGPSPREVMMINQKTEHLPRGTAPQYYAHTYIRIKSNRGDMYKMEDVGFQGYKSTFMLAKSKTNFLGTSFPVCFNSKLGFDPVFTLFEYASELKLIMGRNPYLYLEGMEDMKFSRKEFRNRFINDEEFRIRFTSTLTPYLEAMVGSKRSTDEEVKESMEYGEIMDNLVYSEAD